MHRWAASGGFDAADPVAAPSAGQVEDAPLFGTRLGETYLPTRGVDNGMRGKAVHHGKSNLVRLVGPRGAGPGGGLGGFGLRGLGRRGPLDGHAADLLHTVHD